VGDEVHTAIIVASSMRRVVWKEPYEQ